MKAEFLKIAKCKTEKEFYKKYPTESAFFKAHPEAKSSIKKAQIGAYIGGDAPKSNPDIIDYQEYYDEAEKPITGSTQKEREEAAYKQQMLQSSKTSSSGITDLLGMVKKGMSGGDEGAEGDSAEGLMGMLGGGRNGKHVPKAQVGVNAPSIQTTGYAFGGSPWGTQGVPSDVSSGRPAAGVLTGGTQVSQNVDPFTQTNTSNVQGPGFLNTAMKALPVVGSIVSGIQGLKAEKEAAKAAKQQKTVSGLQLIASATRPEETKRRYVRPEDVAIQPNQMFPTYGVGTNVLARNGMMLQGGGEIQNTYAPDYLYDDLGYEPLNDSNVKQYYRGGNVPKAQSGFSNWASTLGGGGSGFSGAGGGGTTPWGVIGGIGSSMANSAAGGGNASGQIGGGIGEGVGAIFGPAGMAIGKTLGTAVGNALSPYAKKTKRDQAATKRNIENIAYNNMASSFTSPYQAHVRNGGDIANYEEGGWVSHDWQPQVISSFGGLNEQEVYDYAHDGMESLRAGGQVRGEYTPVSNRGMEQYAMGGEVQTTWGGHAETISHNPYMPGTGETIMFRGKSHDESDGNGNTGIGVKYGKGKHDSYTDYAEYGTQQADADVEVERGEPAAELQDANGEKNLTVYGNLKIPNEYVSILGDPKAKGKKFKNYIAEISKDEVKQNKIVENSTNKLNALNVQNQFDKLKLTSLQASIQGANMKLKDIADKKMNAAYLQNAINDTAEENGLVADDLAKGKVKFDKEATDEYARYGKSIPQAKDGDKRRRGVVADLKEGLAKQKAKEEEEKKKGNKYGVIKTLNFDDGTTRYIYSNGRAMDVDKNGKKKMFTPKGNDIVDAVDYKDGNIAKISADGNKYTYYTNGRIAVNQPNKKRYMGTMNDDGTVSWDVGDLRSPEKGGTPKKETAKKDAPTTNAPINNAPTTTRNTTVNPGTPGYVKGRGAKWDYTTIGANQSNPNWQSEEAYNTKWAPTVDAALDDPERAKKILEYIKTYTGPNSDKVKASLSKFPTEKAQLDFLRAQAKNKQISDLHYLMDAGIQSTKPAETKATETKKAEETKKEEDNIYPIEPQKRNTWVDLAGQILPFFRPSDQEAFDYAQLYPEMYALGSNQLEPVQAQGYQPDLATPYDISYQDQLNANQADYNSMQKMVGYNPAAQSILNAQKYAANTGVLGEQFRANQAMKMGVYDQNRQTLNDAKLKNLEIYDQQYERQAQAKSNTKAVTQAALNSIADKYAKNKLENRELGIYENLYNYRYDALGRAINMNAPWQPNVPIVYNKDGQTPNMRAIYDQNGNFLRWERIKEDKTTTATPSSATPPLVAKQKHGGSTKGKNGSIVSAYKNL
jgi:hypothetical protein